MKINYKFLTILLTCFSINSALAQDEKVEQEKHSGPILSGSVLYELQADHLLSISNQKTKSTNGFLYIEPNFGLHFDENWAVKTQWRIQDNSTLTTRDKDNPERYRTFLSDNRGFGLTQTGLLIEELKLNYENEDMKFSLGKFDPSFGTAHRKSKRIGVFASQLAEDYNLREKLGANVTALLEGSQISFSTFFSDSTDLSRSAINDRGRESRNNGLSSNTGSFSSYSILMEGEDFLTVDNWFYNFGFRSLGTDRETRKRENGFVVGSEYLYKIGRETSLIPFFELVKINNFSGENGRSANYITVAAIGKYSSWTTSASLMLRNIKRPSTSALPKTAYDRQLQFSIGYKFTDNLTLDVSRAVIRENAYDAGIFGANLNYLYKF
jgi:hypothetical protein